MALSSVELWQRISTSQLASPMICRAWAADAAAQLPASEAIDGVKVAQQLVAQGKLSQFQADTLVDGLEQKLVEHGYRLLEPVNYTPYPAPDVRSVFSGWWVAAKTPTSAPLWMRWLSVDDLKQPFLAKANPALPRVLQHAQVQHKNLQEVQPPEMANGTLQLTLKPLEGKLLTAWCDGQAKPVDWVLSMMLDVAAGLSALHAVGLTHGRVTPDRIGINSTGSYELLRDPLCSLSMQLAIDDSQRRSPQGLLAQKLPGKLMTAHFMAPEFLAPAQVATPQTDLYSLGCVAWLMLSGKPPVQADSAEKILAAHADRPLDFKRLEQVPEPLARCLWHCLSKNPAARFATGRQLVESLQEAQRIVAAGPVAVGTRPKAEPPASRTQAVEPKPQPVAPMPSLAQTELLVPKDIIEAVKVAEAAPIASAAEASIPSQTIASQKPSAPTSSATTSSSSATSPAPAAPKTSGSPPVAAAKNNVSPQPIETKLAAPSTPTAPSPPRPLTPSSPEPLPASVSPTTPVAPAPIAPAPIAPAPIASAPIAPAPIASAPSVAADVPAPAKAAPRLAAPGKPPARRPAQRGVRKATTKRKAGKNWLTPVIGGGGLVALILLLLVMRGGLGGGNSENPNPNKKNSNVVSGDPASVNNSNNVTSAPPIDPLAEKFELVESDPMALWAPPRAAEPVALELLPPGAQAFVVLRPATLLKSSSNKQLLSLLDADLADFWKWLSFQSGMPLESLERVVVAAYQGQNGLPQYALRVELAEPVPLSKLKAPWNLTTELKVGNQQLLIADSQAYYIAEQPLVDSQSISVFAVGPTEIMRDSVGMQGARGPLPSALEQLWQSSDRQAEFTLLLSPAFLFTEGRSWLEQAPARLKSLVETWLPRDTRAVSLTSSLGERWFYELRLIGISDREAAVNTQKLNDLKQKLPQQVESWLVNELAHPHWRALANRFPGMLRALTAQTRVATENGQAIANGYLPTSAATNLVYASWMSMQPSATAATTVASNATGNASQPSASPLTPAQILDRKITLSTDPVGVEVVLALIAEQANDKLPAGTKPLKFELNGTAFQLAGFTRNFQVRDYKVENQTVREALILLVKKANPVQNAELKSNDQQMIWVLLDADNADKALVSLTSREAATQASQPLPTEFAP